MANIYRLRYVAKDNPHNFVKEVRHALSHDRRPKRVSTRHSWFDKYGNVISYEEERPNILEIKIKDVCQPTIIDYINLLPRDIEPVVINVNFSEENTNYLNSILEVFSSKRTNRNIIINTNNSKFNITNNIYYGGLPSNIKMGNLTYDLRTDFYGENSLDWWSLHLSDEEFDILKEKLIPQTRQRLHKLRIGAKNLYNYLKGQYPNLDIMSNLEKADLVYEYVLRNTCYDCSSTTISNEGILKPKIDCLESTDPIETLERKKGICTGRSRALKFLLNNRYMRVPCFLTDGYRKSGEGHEWVEVYDNNERYYYDLSFGIKGNPVTDSIRIKHDDFDLQGFEAISKIEGKQTNSGYQKRK